MTTPFQRIQHHLLSPGTRIVKDSHTASKGTALDDPATRVVTDFEHIRPFSIEPTASLNEISAKMIACGVRLLFVSEKDGDLVGLVTSTDFLGDKPVTYIQEHGGDREDILAQDIMTPHRELEVLPASAIDHATVGDIVETMKSVARQHMLVVSEDSNGKEVITGLLSTSQIEKQLGITIELSSRANTFSALERAL
jgi:signal-transduction protein with cAMP-binding, CBS, and nucleotidyltransferase domain